MADIIYMVFRHLIDPSFLLILLVIICSILAICILRDNSKLHDEITRLKEAIKNTKGATHE